MANISLSINGKDYALEVTNDELLIDVLRERLHLYGTKQGCGTGECGACSVRVDGMILNACLLFAVRLEGAKIQTVEGVAQSGKLSRLQELFVENAAVQCGFCGPGMILSAQALLDENPKPTDAEIRHGIAGNVCRCSGYMNIVKAIKLASNEL